MMSNMRPFLRCLALVLLLPQCGGGATTGAEPKSAADDRAGSEETNDSAAGGDEVEEQSNESPATAERANGPNCDDGTCSKCGSGICPAGWYCDEKAGGGGACSWLTECADKPTCSCVTRVLGAACKCKEESGGLKVACE
jgi:hypothetical protein